MLQELVAFAHFYSVECIYEFFKLNFFRSEKITGYLTLILVYLTYNLLPGKDVVRNFFITYNGYHSMPDEKDCSM